MAAAVFRPNPAAPAEIEHSAGMSAYLQSTADSIADAAKSAAPVLTGAYQASISGSVEEVDGHPAATVTSTSPYAVYLEFGTEDTPTFQTLRTALDSASF